MANLYLRLVLVNNMCVEAGKPWVDVYGKEQPAQIGAIFYRPESTETYSETDKETGDVVEIVDVTPPHYEIWGKPASGGDWDKANETLCRRIPSTSVLYAEEIWLLDQASRVVAERLTESDTEDGDEEEDEPEAATEGEVPAAPTETVASPAPESQTP